MRDVTIVQSQPNVIFIHEILIVAPVLLLRLEKKIGWAILNTGLEQRKYGFINA